MSRKSNIKNVIRIILFTLLTPLLILYLIAQHFIEPNRYISLRYTLLDYFVDLYNAWREIFGLEYIDKSVELSRYNRKLMYGKPAKKLLGLNKEQMDWLLDNTQHYHGHIWKNGNVERDTREYFIRVSYSRNRIEFYKDKVVMINNESGWVLETDFEGLQENIDNKEFTRWR